MQEQDYLERPRNLWTNSRQRRREPGDTVTLSPTLSKGYCRKDKTMVAGSDDRSCHRRDIALIDQNGYPHYLGRNKKMLNVKRGGGYPAEVEALIGRDLAMRGWGAYAEHEQLPASFLQTPPFTGEDVGAAALTGIGEVRKDLTREQVV